MTIPPIWTNLQIVSHLHNFQNKCSVTGKRKDMVNLKWVALWNKTDVISHSL